MVAFALLVLIFFSSTSPSLIKLFYLPCEISLFCSSFSFLSKPQVWAGDTVVLRPTANAFPQVCHRCTEIGRRGE